MTQPALSWYWKPRGRLEAGIGSRVMSRSPGQDPARDPFRLFGYRLLTSHVHLLLRADQGQSNSRIMQALTVGHTRRYRAQHRSVGHVWQGRFRSPVIQDSDHRLAVPRDIEANPLRARMVTDLPEYRSSSDQALGLGRPDPLFSPFPEWQVPGCSGSQSARGSRTARRSGPKRTRGF
jgi:REP-associated tyrosine transposase